MANYATIELRDIYPPLRYRAPESWWEITRLFVDFVIDNDPLFSSSVTDAAQVATRGANTPREKIDGVLEYLDENIEVDRRAETGDFDDIIEEGRGSPYLVTGLAQAMLSEADVESSYLAVHSARNGRFDRAFVTPRELRMPALRVQTEQDSLYLFPFLKNLPTDVIPKSYQGQPALVVEPLTDKEEELKRQYGDEYVNKHLATDLFTTIPRSGSSQNLIEADYEVDLTKQGEIRVVELKKSRGADAYKARRALGKLTNEERDEKLTEFLTYTDGSVNWSSRTVNHLNTFDQPLHIRLEYTIDNLLTLTPKEVLFQTAGLFSPLTGTKKKVNPGNRTNPIKIHFTQTLEKHIEISPPGTSRLNWMMYRSATGLDASTAPTSDGIARSSSTRASH